jgi:hypothetical protein
MTLSRWSLKVGPSDMIGAARGNVSNSSASRAWRSWLNFGGQMIVCPLGVASIVWADAFGCCWTTIA